MPPVKMLNSSTTTDITGDADDIDYKFSETDNPSNQNTPPNIIQIHPVLRQMICRCTPSSSNHAHTQRRPCALRLTSSPMPYPFNSKYTGTRIETTVMCSGLDSALYIHTPPLFQVELAKRWLWVGGLVFGVRVQCREHWTKNISNPTINSKLRG